LLLPVVFYLRLWQNISFLLFVNSRFWQNVVWQIVQFPFSLANRACIWQNLGGRSVALAALLLSFMLVISLSIFFRALYFKMNLKKQKTINLRTRSFLLTWAILCVLTLRRTFVIFRLLYFP
jgi:hypothetical protein